MGVAAATGVTVHQLRLWERRYGYPVPGRSASGHRRYRPEEVDAVRRMRDLIGRGVPGELAAQSARAELAGLSGMKPSLDTHAPGLLRHVAALDGPGLDAALAAACEPMPPEDAFDTVVAPLLRAVGERWEAGEMTPAHEHFATQRVRRTFDRLFPAATVVGGPRPILVACPAGEEHDLPATLLTTTLEWHGRPAVCLGADVPSDAFATAIERVEPSAVCLVVTADTSVPAARLAADSLRRAGARMLFAGRAMGTAIPALPGEHLASFAAAVRALAPKGAQ